MNRLSIAQLKVLVFIGCLLPAGMLIYGAVMGQLGANPIEVLTRDSGTWALRFLLLTLCLTPLRWLTGINSIIRFRRMIGLFVFFYAVVHMTLYLWLDQFFDWHEIWLDILKRPFITIGFISFVLLIPLVVTSTNGMMKRLGARRWKALHRLTYVIAALSCLHYLMLIKADITEPMIYFMILAVLLGFRLYRLYVRPLVISNS